MARTRTMVQLIADVRYQADLEGQTDRHPDANLERLINQSLCQLREIVTDAGHGHYVTSVGGNTVAGTATISIPGSVSRIMGIEITANGITRTLQEHALIERNEWDTVDNSAATGVPCTFRIQALSTITLLPTPDAVYTYIIHYVANYTDITGAVATVDDSQGWVDWAVYDASIKALARDDDDEQIAKLMALRSDMEQRIKDAAARRVQVNPGRRLDTRGMRRRDAYRARDFWRV